MSEGLQYFYAAQLRNYRLQVIRAFSNFSVSFGTNEDGSPKLKRVPCRYGDTSRMAEMIIAGNSENRIPSAPFISVWVNGLALAPERRAAPSLVSTLNVNEREYDGSSQRYTNNSGNRYTVKRLMPVPFTMTVNVDFWTSNLTQKEELFEQTQVLFNGMIDMQTSVNPIDWTLFSTIEPTNITWTSRSIPIGTDNPIDVMSIEYKIPIWINPPAQVTYQQLIEQIVTNISEATWDQTAQEWTPSTLLSRITVTPEDASIEVSLVTDNLYELALLGENGSKQDPRNLPTQINSATIPIAQAGAKFSVNNVPITVPNSNINDLISVMRNQFQGNNLNVRLLLNNRLQLIDLSGGSIVLENIEGTGVESLGFVSGVYPGGTQAWWRLLDYYGALDQDKCLGTKSQLSLLISDDFDNRSQDITGTISFHPTNQNLLYWQIDSETLPSHTIASIDAVINPQTVWPGNGLAPSSFGQRYLIIDEIAVQSAAWGPVLAQPNDIIEYDGNQWIQSFDSSTDAVALTFNKFSKKYYLFDQSQWQVFPPVKRGPGQWRLNL